MSHLIISPLAAQDMEDILDYISRDKPWAALNFVEKIYERCRMLAENPEMGEQRPDLAENLRAFSLGNYVIFYCSMAGGIKVVRVVSGYRNPKTLF